MSAKPSTDLFLDGGGHRVFLGIGLALGLREVFDIGAVEAGSAGAIAAMFAVSDADFEEVRALAYEFDLMALVRDASKHPKARFPDGIFGHAKNDRLREKVQEIADFLNIGEWGQPGAPANRLSIRVSGMRFPGWTMEEVQRRLDKGDFSKEMLKRVWKTRSLFELAPYTLPGEASSLGFEHFSLVDAVTWSAHNPFAFKPDLVAVPGVDGETEPFLLMDGAIPWGVENLRGVIPENPTILFQYQLLETSRDLARRLITRIDSEYLGHLAVKVPVPKTAKQAQVSESPAARIGRSIHGALPGGVRFDLSPDDQVQLLEAGRAIAMDPQIQEAYARYVEHHAELVKTNSGLLVPAGAATESVAGGLVRDGSGNTSNSSLPNGKSKKSFAIVPWRQGKNGGSGSGVLVAQDRGRAKSLVAKGHGTNGHGTNGHGTNGHGTNGHGTNGHGTNGHGISPKKIDTKVGGDRGIDGEPGGIPTDGSAVPTSSELSRVDHKPGPGNGLALDGASSTATPRSSGPSALDVGL